MAVADAKTLERISAARSELELRIQSEMELLDALKKVEVFFASVSGTMTPLAARKLLLEVPGRLLPGEAARSLPVGKGDWATRILAVLAAGPKTSREMLGHLRADGFALGKPHSFYSAMARMRGNKQIVQVAKNRYALPGSAPRPKGRPLKSPTSLRWSVAIPAMLSDGTPRTTQQIFDVLQAEHGALSRKRLGVMLPYLLHRDVVARDAQKRYTLKK